MEPFISQIIIMGCNFAPRGFAQCDGQLLAIASNSALFSLVGTIYGGDGRTSLGLPDLRGRSAVHYGTGPGLPTIPQGAKSGAPTTTLGVQNMPPHNHQSVMKVAASSGTVGSIADGNYLASTARGGAVIPDIYANPAGAGSLSPGAIQVGMTGGGQSFNNYQPYQAVNYCIALQGIFPSRS